MDHLDSQYRARMNHMPVDPDQLPLDDFHLHLEKAVDFLTGRPRHCGRNAFRCLRRAWVLRSIDPEMAVFRAITAEEEAATGLMFALKHRSYPGSHKLLPRDHVQKAAWLPFIEAIGTLMAESGLPLPRMTLRATERPRVDIVISAKAINFPGVPDDQVLVPDEPLDLVIQSGKEGEAPTLSTFDDELQAWAAKRGKATILEYLKEAANLRNQVLYAGDDGMPNAGEPTALILERRRRVIVLLVMTIAVLQAKKPQLLAVQALNAFLKLLQNTDGIEFDFESASQPADVQIFTTLDPMGGLHRTEVIAKPRQFTVQTSLSCRWDWGWNRWPGLEEPVSG